METVNQENSNVTSTETTEKTFTQADMDALAGKIRAQVTAKYADYEELKEKAEKFDAAEEEKKTELEKAQDKIAKLSQQVETMKKADTIRTIREKVATETGVPVGVLTGETEDACREQAKQLLEWKQPGYPQTNDGGEPTPPTGDTRDEFANWLNQSLKR